MFVAYSSLSGTIFGFHEGRVCACREKGIYKFYSIKKKTCPKPTSNSYYSAQQHSSVLSSTILGANKRLPKII